jgi:hypothetical protein
MTGHLIHIGYAKAGSNFLRSWFARHSQLAYAPGGIAGFHDIYSLARESASQGRRPLYRVTSSEGLATPHIVMDGFRGFATSLRDEPLYRAYARDYLFE